MAAEGSIPTTNRVVGHVPSYHGPFNGVWIVACTCGWRGQTAASTPDTGLEETWREHLGPVSPSRMIDDVVKRGASVYVTKEILQGPSPWAADHHGQVERESDHEHMFVVKVRAFGHPDKTLLEAARSLAIAMHRMDPTDDWGIWVGGRRVLFDHWAQDGEHEGHDDPILVEEPH